MHIRVLVADDDPLVRLALTALLRLEWDIDVVAAVPRCPSAVLLHAPDVAVVGLGSPGADGLAVVGELDRVLPSCAVVVLTGDPAPHARQVLATPARAVLPKSSPSGVLAEVIRRVHAGGRHVHPALAAGVLVPTSCPLTPRELEVLRLATPDTPPAEVARLVGLSLGTVRNHLSAVVRKLGTTNRADAFTTARDNGWL